MAAQFKPCLVDGCNGNAHYAAGGVKGWCRAHYRRNYRHGDPTAGQTFKGAPLECFEASVGYSQDECLIWPFARDAKGYGQINANGAIRYVHRLMCERVKGPAPTEGLHAAHSCGNGHLGCFSPKHVRWATIQENATDKEIHGTLPLGAEHHAALLTDVQVREIRSLRGVMTQKEIGAKFGVHKETVGSIQRRENWRWLD